MSLFDACREASAITAILQELGLEMTGPFIAYEDNNAAKTKADQLSTKGSRHVSVRYHFVRQLSTAAPPT